MIILFIILCLAILILFISCAYSITDGKVFKKIGHDIFGWHIPDTNKMGYFDGCSVHATCKICHKDIMQDGQGNWF